jgi:hypothetical protein
LASAPSIALYWAAKRTAVGTAWAACVPAVASTAKTLSHLPWRMLSTRCFSCALAAVVNAAPTIAPACAQPVDVSASEVWSDFALKLAPMAPPMASMIRAIGG